MKAPARIPEPANAPIVLVDFQSPRTTPHSKARNKQTHALKRKARPTKSSRESLEASGRCLSNGWSLGSLGVFRRKKMTMKMVAPVGKLLLTVSRIRRTFRNEELT